MTDVLAFEATKPYSDTRKLFVLNQNEGELFGEIWVESALNISWQTFLGQTENPKKLKMVGGIFIERQFK